MKKTMGRRLAALALVLVLCLSLSAEVFAANVCQEIKGNSNKSVTFRIITGKRFLFKDKVTFRQDKGTLLFSNWSGSKEKRVAAYDTFTIRYRKEGSSTWKTATMKNGSCTIKLDYNSTYIVTVTPASLTELQFRYFLKGAIEHWEKPAAWRIGKTKGVTLCQ